MKILEKILVLLLIFSLLNLYLPRVSFSQVGFIEPEKITKHPPEMRSSPEENISVEEVTRGRTGSGWAWIALGLLVVGGAIAVAAGGGGGGGGSSSSSSSSSTNGGNRGSVAVGW